MAPKRGREQLARQNVTVIQPLAPEVIAKRTRRHLDELERSNYAETTLLAGVGDDGAEGRTKGRGRELISDKRNFNIAGNSAAARKKKSTMAVRTALLYRKNLATLVEESNIASLPSSVATYLTATTAPAPYPPRMICTVCGYLGKYRCRRCAMLYCDMNCERVHAETRCERRAL